VKILVIDDSPEILTLFSEYLRAEGYEVDTSADGSTGIEMIEKKAYDLILTDMKMPSIDGMKVLEFSRITHRIQSASSSPVTER
jgi:CheY-like chemotaxis protein